MRVPRRPRHLYRDTDTTVIIDREDPWVEVVRSGLGVPVKDPTRFELPVCQP